MAKDNNPYATFSKDNLELILAAKNLQELKAQLDNEQYKIIIAIMAQSEARLRNRNAFIRSLIPAVQAGAAPIEIWWAASNFFNLGAAAFALAGAFLGLTAAVGGSYFYFSYKSTQKKVKERIDFCKLAELRLSVYDELFTRKGIESHGADLAILHNISEKRFSLPKTRLAALGVGAGAAGTIFASYYIGITSFLKALGATSSAALMLGPIGIALACSIAVIAGIYLGYRYYQAKKGLQDIKMLEHRLNMKLMYKKAEYTNSDIVTKANSVSKTSSPIPIPGALTIDDILDSPSTSIISRTFFSEESSSPQPEHEEGDVKQSVEKRFSFFSNNRGSRSLGASPNDSPQKGWKRLSES